MKAIKLSIIHQLKPTHPLVNDIDTEELNEAIHAAIDDNLEAQAEALINSTKMQYVDSDDDTDSDDELDDIEDLNDDSPLYLDDDSEDDSDDAESLPF